MNQRLSSHRWTGSPLVLIDAFCKAGGCTKGYQRAGFYVIGIDIEPQPNYCGDDFIQADAVEFLRALLDGPKGFSALGNVVGFHASPPCQGYSRLAAMHPGKEYPLLIEPVRDIAVESGLPYIIENVEGSPLASRPQLDGTWGVELCGSMFGLGVERGFLRRHRLFETNFPVRQPTCNHKGLAVGVYGHGGHTGKHRMLYRQEAAEAMDIDWMTRDEMTQAIPPAYTEHIGRDLMEEVKLRAQAVAA